jgi:hypothetical protein
MAWEKRKRDHNIMFAVNYEDGRTAYLTIRPPLLRDGDHVVPTIVRNRQGNGEIPEGPIVTIRRVR